LGNRLDRLTGEFLDLLGQALDLALQRLYLVAAGHTQTRDGAVQALVEGLFQLVPLAESLVLDFIDLGLGATDGGADARLDHVELLFDFSLGLLLGLLAILDQAVEQLAAVVADLGVGAEAGQPDLPRVLLDFTDQGTAFLFGGNFLCCRFGRRFGGSFLNSHPFCSPYWVRATRSSNAFSSSSLARSEEHTSELQSRENLVCRLVLEKKKTS